MSTWNLAAPPGFQGLRDDLPVEVYVRHLPHWRQQGATYFVTARLGDSLPQSKLRELEALRRDWELRHRPPYSRRALEDLARLAAVKVEAWLDEGLGSCVLKDQSNAGLLVEAMHHFDGERYELGAYVVMPNHLHAIVRPTNCGERDLEDALKSWKQYSSTNIIAGSAAKASCGSRRATTASFATKNTSIAASNTSGRIPPRPAFQKMPPPCGSGPSGKPSAGTTNNRRMGFPARP
jgi:hypothetical protein